MSKFQRIGLLAGVGVGDIAESLRRLETFLCAQGCEVIYEEYAAGLINWQPPGTFKLGGRSAEVDLCIVVGGDGSMLTVARKLAGSGIPLLGINRGRLGFLTDILPNEIEQRVLAVLDGEYTETRRFMLDTHVTRGDQLIGRGRAINDVVLHPGKSVRMMEFDLYVDKEFVYSQRSDGLIVSTPTGSTAYALSAGGPILFPELDAVIVVPLNPHTLSSRPIVLSGDAKIEIMVGSRNELHPSVTCDGHNDLVTEPGDIISINKHCDEVIMIHPKEHNFYKVCRSKLGWGSRLGAPLKE